ncbi:MAG: efflux RND transporter permease subunit [Alistipes sp.]|nr:efflux RND transporter permease subunit [Alistipes sp.]
MNISRYSILRPSVIIFLLVVILLGGIYAFEELGKREDSTFVIKSAIVICPYAGATPLEVESLVSKPLERGLRTLSSVHKITSESHYGYARLVVELHPSTAPERIPQLWDELRRKVSDLRTQLPDGVGEISVVDDFGDVFGLYYALYSEGGYTIEEMGNYVDNITTKLYAIKGVEKVQISGLATEEVNIWLSPATLSAFELRPESIARAIREQNAIAGLGIKEAGEVDITLTEGSTYSSITDIENQLLIAEDGKQYRLGDVARVVREVKTPRSMIMSVDGKEAVAIAVATDPEMDIVKVGDRVDSELKSLVDELPAGLDIVSLYPENRIAEQANNDFIINLLESLLIVVLLVIIVMGWREGIIVGSSLLFAIGATLVVMYLVGEGLNRTSLAGFIIAMGMLVDNAIVVVDNSTKYMRAGMIPTTAVVQGATLPRMPLLAATLIAIISFLPLQLAPSSVAEIIAPLFRVIALSLLISWVLSLTQVPMMSLWLLPHSKHRDGAKRYGAVSSMVRWVLHHRWLTIACGVVVLVMSLWLMGRMPQNFFPQLAKPYFRADVILPDGYDIETSAERLDSMTKWLKAQPEVKCVSTTAGGTPPRYYLASGSYSSKPNYGNILVEVWNTKQTSSVEERFDRWVTDNFADVWLRSSLFRLSPVPEATIEIGFIGENIDTLSRLTHDAMAIMEQREDTRNVRNSWGNRVAVWQPDYAQLKAQRLGVERSSMVSSLEIATSGLSVATYREADVQMPILLRTEHVADSSILGLSIMPIFSMRGRSYSLEQAVSGFDFGFYPSVIRRIDSERVMKAQCDPERGVNAIALLNNIEKQVHDNIDIPDGYRMEVFGEQESREESNDALRSKLPVTMILIFVILLFLFGNLRDPLVVLLTLPLIFTGVVVGLAISGKMFDFFSLLGLLGLVGMNIKNAVILLSRISELRDSGLEAVDAVVRAVEDRSIPVITASATTLLGMTPLLFDSMFGSMAVTIMGGLIVATIMVLVILPVVYSLFYRIKL